MKIIAIFYFLVFQMATASGAPIDKAVWVGNAVQKISERDAWETIFVLDLTNRAAKAGAIRPGDKQAWAFELLDAAWNRRDLALRDTRAVNTGFAYKVYEAMKQAGFGGDLAGNALIEWLEESTKNTRLNTYVNARQALYSDFSKYAAKSGDVLQRAYDLAENDPVYKDFLNRLVARSFGSSLEDPAADILRRNPALRGNPDVAALVAANGNPGAVDTANAATQGRIKDVAASVDKLKNGQPAVNPETDAERATRQKTAEFFQVAEARARREQQFAVERVYANSVRSGAYVVGTLLGGKRGQDLIATANLITDVYGAFSQYSSNMDLLSTDDGAMALTASSTILMGNLIAAGQLFMTAMGPKEEPPEKALFDALIIISQQIVDFQVEVNARFDHVDRSLATMYGEMMSGFATMSQSLQTANFNLSERSEERRVGKECA